MFQQIYEMLMKKYGHLSYPEITAALRKDGYGELVDAIENDPGLMAMISKMTKEITADLVGDEEYGVMPSPDQQICGIPVDYHGTFKFDAKACLEKCTGNCCKNKNYLMISIIDIFRMLSSKGAKFLEIHTTMDLFDRKPPLVELFYSEEYKIFLPYIRYLPVDADLNIRPEDANGSICPFLLPINEVYSYHKRELPHWTSKDAMGCILREDKPSICRFSPLGECRGMITGKITYEYMPPVPDCPACDTDVEVKLSDYVSSIVTLSEQKQQERFHQILMSYNKQASKTFDQDRFNKIIKQVHNIDGLLSQYGFGTEQRPHVDHLIEMVFRAAKGDFRLYEQFVDGLSNSKK